MSLNGTERFAAELTDLELDLSSFSASTQRRIWSILRQLQDEVSEEIAQSEIDGEVRSDWRIARANSLATRLRVPVSKAFADAAKTLDAALVDAAKLTNQGAAQVFNSTFTVDIVQPTLNATELRSLVDRQNVLGEPLKDYWAGQSEGTRRRFAKQIRLGVAQGETNAQLIQRVRGTHTGQYRTITLKSGATKRVGVFAGGAMDVTTQQAETLVRTSVQSVSNDVLRRTYADNADLIRGVQALTTLDGKTSDICMARTGAAWDLDGKALPESTVQEDFPGEPPWHPNCRTVLVPILKSWEQLIEEQTGKRMKVLETVGDSTRASMDGQVSNNLRTFDDWLKAKGDVFARKKLGATRFDLWKSGAITTRDLIDARGNPRSIAEILAARGLAEAS